MTNTSVSLPPTNAAITEATASVGEEFFVAAMLGATEVRTSIDCKSIDDPSDCMEGFVNEIYEDFIIGTECPPMFLGTLKYSPDLAVGFLDFIASDKGHSLFPVALRNGDGDGDEWLLFLATTVKATQVGCGNYIFVTHQPVPPSLPAVWDIKTLTYESGTGNTEYRLGGVGQKEGTLRVTLNKEGVRDLVNVSTGAPTSWGVEDLLKLSIEEIRDHKVSVSYSLERWDEWEFQSAVSALRE